jgi:hypothetical protein
MFCAQAFFFLGDGFLSSLGVFNQLLSTRREKMREKDEFLFSLLLVLLLLLLLLWVGFGLWTAK